MGKNKSIFTILTSIYIVIALFEVIAEYNDAKGFLVVIKLLIPLSIIVLYLIVSTKKQPLFILAMFFSLLTNLLYIPSAYYYLLFALIAFIIHRILVIRLIVKYNRITDYIPVIIATAPFLVISFYLLMETNDIPEDSFYLLVLQNILISIFAGISLSSYVMKDSKQNSILLISALLFVMLQFAIFIQKYFLIDEYQQILRPLAMLLNSLAFYSFFRYVIEAENSNND